jgi:Domain of unknown function (DUF4872)/Butirosin biosynthesis protein H, N-terminal
MARRDSKPKKPAQRARASAARPAAKKRPAAPTKATKPSKPTRAARPTATRLGGVHGDSAALKDLLAITGIRRADTKEPLSEALCFGIAGGIAAGYTLVPGFVATGLGSGVTFVGRHRQFLADGKWHTEFFRRLGMRCDVSEEPHPDRAAANLSALLLAKRPTIVWCSAMAFAHLSWASTAGLHTLLAHGFAPGRKRVVVSDQGPATFELELAELNLLRERVNPAQNRLLGVALEERGRAISRDELVAACVAGLKACVLGARDLEQRGRHALPLADCANSMAQLHHSQGWRHLFPEGQLFLVLADVFQSIEAAWNGGGFFRPLFATYLDEVAALTGDPRFAQCGAAVRALGARWTRFAESALPKKYALFARSREAYRAVEQIYAKKGIAAESKLRDLRTELADGEKKALARFPLDGHQANRLLDDLATELAELAAAEERVAAELRAVVR